MHEYMLYRRRLVLTIRHKIYWYIIMVKIWRVLFFLNACMHLWGNAFTEIYKFMRILKTALNQSLFGTIFLSYENIFCKKKKYDVFFFGTRFFFWHQIFFFLARDLLPTGQLFRLAAVLARWETDPESAKSKPNQDCNYKFPIDLAQQTEFRLLREINLEMVITIKIWCRLTQFGKKFSVNTVAKMNDSSTGENKTS